MPPTFRIQSKLFQAKHSLLLSAWLLCFTKISAQQFPVASEILSSKEINALFTDSLKTAINLNYPIYRVYRYRDISGSYYCALTESRDVITSKDTTSYKIRAINLKAINGKYSKLWELNDFIIKSEKEENGIWFWTKYSDFKDYDKDSLIEPVILYGTTASNGYSDGRIKILIYYKGQKIAIRHQNGELDYERETQVDKAFYDLPVIIQMAVKQKMDLLVKNNLAIFPSGWQTAMKNKKTVFNERK